MTFMVGACPLITSNPRGLDADLEAMCCLFAHVHEQKFGAWPETGSGISRETCQNPTGWSTH